MSASGQKRTFRIWALDKSLGDSSSVGSRFESDVGSQILKKGRLLVAFFSLERLPPWRHLIPEHHRASRR
jgi:hypothetical protein